MLYKFKSRATPDLIMLEENGRQVLEIIGKTPGPTGIIQADQIPAALAALEQAVAQDEVNGRQGDADAEAVEDEPEANSKGGVRVSLRQRVAPLAEMLRQSAADGKEVVWGV